MQGLQSTWVAVLDGTPHIRSVAFAHRQPSGRERVRRFVEAWRWLIAARAQIKSAGLSAEESDRYLAGAGVLVRVVPPGSGRRSRRRA